MHWVYLEFFHSQMKNKSLMRSRVPWLGSPSRPLIIRPSHSCYRIFTSKWKTMWNHIMHHRTEGHANKIFAGTRNGILQERLMDVTLGNLFCRARCSTWSLTFDAAKIHRLRSTSAYVHATMSNNVLAPSSMAFRMLDSRFLRFLRLQKETL